MYQYRFVLARMQRGDTDRELARGRYMGRRKLGELRQLAAERGWLAPDAELPDDETIAARRARVEEIDVIDECARAILVHQRRCERGFDSLPRHALRKNCQRVSKIDHLIEAAAEKVVGGQCAKLRSDRCEKLSGSADDYNSFRKFTPPSMDRKSSAGAGLRCFAGPTIYAWRQLTPIPTANEITEPSTRTASQSVVRQMGAGQ